MIPILLEKFDASYQLITDIEAQRSYILLQKDFLAMQFQEGLLSDIEVTTDGLFLTPGPQGPVKLCAALMGKHDVVFTRTGTTDGLYNWYTTEPTYGAQLIIEANESASLEGEVVQLAGF